MVATLVLSIAFLIYSRRKMMRGYSVPEDHTGYDDLAPETSVEYNRY
jgi:hypothetical protein